MGYGGLPSNYSSIVSNAASVIALAEGIIHPAFGVAIALVLAFIVVIDASSLQRQVGKHASAINAIAAQQSTGRNKYSLREKMGTLPLKSVQGLF